jgi:hypothetical protein
MPVSIFCHPKSLFKRPTQQAHISRVEAIEELAEPAVSRTKGALKDAIDDQ